MKSATAFAPATVANVAVGFDLLGFPIDGVGDRITVTRIPTRAVKISALVPWRLPATAAQRFRSLPSDPKKNACTKGLLQLMKDRDLDHGFSVSIEKGIPLGSGMGGSAASSVGAIVAASRLLRKPLSPAELLHYALLGEEAASGARHGDNVAPCLLGGLVATMGGASPRLISIPIPRQIRCVVVYPGLRVDTKRARAILSPHVSLKAHVEQSQLLAGFLAGCFQKDRDLISQSLKDILIEPQRAGLVPGFRAVKAAALAHGAMGCSLSGSGPSVFAWTDSLAKAKRVERAMIRAFRSKGLSPLSWISSIRKQGAEVATR